VQHAALLRGEDVVVGTLARDVLGQLVGEEPWQRHGASLVVLRRIEDGSPIDVGDRLRDQRDA
jgi:hypothetical protein